MKEDHATWKERLGIAIPVIVLALLTLPILIGYAWIIISTFSRTTYGLEPQGKLTLQNWSFLWEDPKIWSVTRALPMKLAFAAYQAQSRHHATSQADGHGSLALRMPTRTPSSPVSGFV